MKKCIPIIKQLALFGIVGVITLGIDVGVTAAAYYVLGVPAYAASAIGFLSGFVFNFPMNRKNVFNHTDADRFSLRQQIIMYASLAGFNLVATSAMVEVLVSSGVVEIQYAKLIVTAVIAVWNFAIFKWIVFSKKTNL